MKTRILILLFTLGACSMAHAVGVSDIVSISTNSNIVVQDAQNLQEFSRKLITLNANGFTDTVAGSTQTVTYTLLQKQGLIAWYQALKAQLQLDFQQLP